MPGKGPEGAPVAVTPPESMPGADKQACADMVGDGETGDLDAVKP
jgi:hypothetical protein